MAFWSNREETQLIELVGRGITEEAIAERLGRTPAAVQAHKAALRREGRLAPSRAPRRVPSEPERVP